MPPTPIPSCHAMRMDLPGLRAGAFFYRSAGACSWLAVSTFFGSNQSQPRSTMNNLQQEMPFLALVKGPEDVPMEFIKACKSELDALNLCMNLSRFSDETLRDKLGIDKGHFSRLRKGRGNFPPNKRIQLMQLCGNRAPVQFEAYVLGCELVERSKDQRIRELEAQLEQLKAA